MITLKAKVQLTPPEELEKEMLRRWPTLDGYTAHMRQLNLAWPRWCYLPMSVSLALATHGLDKHFAELYLKEIGTDIIYKLSAIIPWRIEKRIYMFDKTFARHIQRPVLNVSEVVSALKKIPSPCVYISEPPGLDNCQGVFCFLDSQRDRPETVELRLHYLFADGTVIAVYTVLDPDHILRFRAEDEQDKVKAQLCKDNAYSHLCMLMYLCEENTDIVRFTSRLRTIKRGGLALAVHPDVYHVGYETGIALRKKAAQIRAGEPARSD